ncbi:hypothetical protein [Dysgonomonas sp. 25]|uniref:hypothetical protein n=1 Tax=Dysgonomonas sp. 25 TaxID=2302933 RepID=UPI0013D7900B|nr:hypothetical protein [Dysgonomonas sp. 25]NDV68042.1 hypothetical protein [Dysgonomonas sp. 25]
MVAIKDTLKIGSTIYGVDLKTLKITPCDRRNLHNMRQYTTTYEDFSRSDLDLVLRNKLLQNKLPIEYDGVMYFGTEEEAIEFIKFQIGI